MTRARPSIGDSIAVGFDVGGTNVRGVVVRSDGSVGEAIKIPRPQDPQEMVDEMARLRDQLAAAEQNEVGAVGVGCAGIVDSQGVVRTSPNIGSLVRFGLKDSLDERLGTDTLVDNDATTAAWAEASLGVAQGVADMLFVAFGTGIGSGLVLGGSLHRGASGFAGEAGHMVVAHQGIRCVCGRRGCWERYASGTALERLAQEAAADGRADSLLELSGGDVAQVTSEHVAKLVARDDPAANAVLAELAHWVAVGLSNLVNIVDPAMIVLGGGLADIGEPFAAAVRHAYAEVMLDAHLRDPVRIELSLFGGGAGAIGAAVLACGT